MLSAELTDRGAIRALDRLSRIKTSELAEDLGAIVESQTRRRISEEKTAPEGEPWAPWADGYRDGEDAGGKPRRDRKGRYQKKSAGGGILVASGALLDSIAYVVGDDEVTVGSALAYAGAHQEGNDTTPARPYLGLSAENTRDLVEAVGDFLAEAAR